ncbi:MAG: YitT family protein [Deltaproteobacteria bacterium]|nr:YitT family protein [Deltaproteobacteria bacterium]
MTPVKRSFRQITAPSKHVVWNLILIAAGSMVCCASVNGILIPKGFFGAGFTGLSLVIHYLDPSLPVWVLYSALNIPVFILGWRYVGRRFFLYSIAGMALFTGALAWVQVSIPVEDKILGALLAGIIMGVGSGIILRSLGSAGGLDVLSVILLKRFSLRLGTTILAFNSTILAAGAFLFSLEGALYTLIYVFVNSFVVDLVITGLSQRRAVFIISPEWERISREVMEKIRRGVTIIEGRGGYTGREMQILYTVVTFREVPRLKHIARNIDPDVFLVVSDTREVMGTRIGNQPHW